MPGSLRARTVLVVIALVAACGPAAVAPTPPPAGSSSQATPEPGQPSPTSTSADLTLPPFPSESPTVAPSSGVSLRVVNLTVSASGPGPTLEVAPDLDGPPLATVGPGDVSAFADVPAARSGTGPATLTVRDPAAPGGSVTSISLRGMGSAVTAVLYTSATLGAASTSVFVFSDTFPAWPTVSASQATVLVYDGPLNALPDVLENVVRDDGAVALGLADGRCLVDAETGRDATRALGGTIPRYLAFPEGSHELVVGARATPCERHPITARIILDVVPGTRLAVFPWGTSWETLQLLAVPVS